jgi:hypothetical protein
MSYCVMEGLTVMEYMPSPCRNGCKEYMCSCIPIVVAGAWLFGECMEVSYCEWCVYCDECSLD